MTLNSDMEIGLEKHGSISSEDCMAEDDQTTSNAHRTSRGDSRSPDLTKKGGRSVSPIKGSPLKKIYTAGSKISGKSPKLRDKKRRGTGNTKIMVSPSQDWLGTSAPLDQERVSRTTKINLKKFDLEGNVFFGGAKEKKAPKPGVAVVNPESKIPKKIISPDWPTRGARKLTQSLQVYKIGSYGDIPDASSISGSRRQVAAKTSIPNSPGDIGSKGNKRPLNKPN
jgi:hypothetical protein